MPLKQDIKPAPKPISKFQEKTELRAAIKTANTKNKKDELVFIHMRKKYYRGIRVKDKTKLDKKLVVKEITNVRMDRI